ncbi:MAG TPA: tetratricopeptide repeat protein [Candidatus Binatia bacterium]|nr:tetratricopeptide repeat protein [Candidatus Binatia bacterium]
MPLDSIEVPPSVGSAAKAVAVATHEYLGWIGDPLATLTQAVEADPDFAFGHTLIGALRVLSGETGGSAGVQAALAAARKNEAKLGAWERGHIAALEAWAGDRIRRAVAIWEEILIEHPRDVWALRFAHDTYFYLGDAGNLRDSIARVLPEWPEDDALHGFLLGMHAFGLEEVGDFRQAEVKGRRAVERNPKDTWAIHAVGHVLEMEGRTIEGIGWYRDLKEHWTPAVGLAVHQWWHYALYLIERGRLDEALALYDDEIRAAKSGALLDLVDAAALLWRLKLAGVDTGTRWKELAPHWYGHIDDHVLVFNDVHIALAAGIAADRAAEARLDKSLGDYIARAKGTNRDVSADVGQALVRAIAAFSAGDFGRTVDLMLPVRGQIRRIGGSNAQRDLFNQTLIAAAIGAGRLPLARALLAERTALKPNSVTARKLYEEVLGTLGRLPHGG